MKTCHEGHTKEKIKSSSKVGDEGFDAVDVSARDHLHRGVHEPEGEYEVLDEHRAALSLSKLFVLVENARPLVLGHNHNSLIVAKGQIPIGTVVCPANFVKAGLTRIAYRIFTLDKIEKPVFLDHW